MSIPNMARPSRGIGFFIGMAAVQPEWLMAEYLKPFAPCWKCAVAITQDWAFNIRDEVDSMSNGRRRRHDGVTGRGGGPWATGAVGGAVLGGLDFMTARTIRLLGLPKMVDLFDRTAPGNGLRTLVARVSAWDRVDDPGPVPASPRSVCPP